MGRSRNLAGWYYFKFQTLRLRAVVCQQPKFQFPHIQYNYSHIFTDREYSGTFFRYDSLKLCDESKTQSKTVLHRASNARRPLRDGSLRRLAYLRRLACCVNDPLW